MINIITGLMKPSHGSVYISGLDVDMDASSVQQITGVCPQHDLLWSDLSAREHMYLTSAFKGIQFGKPLEEAVERMLAKMNLLHRADNRVGEFSGGMRRRLSVAMSTVGEIEIVFLDEPSTGLDPISRRRIWDAINWMKKTRVVVLTTHNMEEADYLGDEIMILHGGHVRAKGNSLFLKQIYGKGYQVSMIADFQEAEKIEKVVGLLLPGANCCIDEVTGSITVSLSQNDVIRLPKLFAWLERSKRAAAFVREWSISNTTLEQVFLLLCVQNTEENYTATQLSDDDRLCPMCRERTKGPVLLKTLLNQHILIPNSVCVECSKNNAHYIVIEDDVGKTEGGENAIEMTTLLTEAQKKANSAACDDALLLENEEDIEFEVSQTVETEVAKTAAVPDSFVDDKSVILRGNSQTQVQIRIFYVVGCVELAMCVL